MRENELITDWSIRYWSFFFPLLLIMALFFSLTLLALVSALAAPGCNGKIADFDAHYKEWAEQKASSLRRSLSWTDAYGKHEHLAKRPEYRWRGKNLFEGWWLPNWQQVSLGRQPNRKTIEQKVRTISKDWLPHRSLYPFNDPRPRPSPRPRPRLTPRPISRLKPPAFYRSWFPWGPRPRPSPRLSLSIGYCSLVMTNNCPTKICYKIDSFPSNTLDSFFT